MTMDYTSRLLLQKPDPDPVTGDFLDVSVLNANFDALDAVVSFTPATSTARPPDPFQGQGILETDTGKAYVWGGSAYSQLLTSGAAYDFRIGLGRLPSNNAARLLYTWGPGGGSTPQVTLQTFAPATGHRALSVLGGSDTLDRWWVDFDGSMQWSSGSAGGDISVKRSAPGVLDVETGTLTVGGVRPGSVDVQTFTASGTWTKPTGAKQVWVRMVGGGGAGGGAQVSVANQHSKGGGGGGGEYVEIWYAATVLGATVTVTVGAGAVGDTGAGVGGGASLFNGVGANGGSGGSMNTSNPSSWGQSGGEGGLAGAGTATLRSQGQGGHFGYGDAALSAGGAGGASALGGGGRGQASGSTIASVQGDDATGYGGGGGGALVNTTGASVRGGHGKSGVVIVTTFF